MGYCKAKDPENCVCMNSVISSDVSLKDIWFGNSETTLRVY